LFLPAFLPTLAAIWRSRVALAVGLRERLVMETPEVDMAV
jgi:hypothetical protein